MLAEGFGLAFDEGALVLPACMQRKFCCCLAFSQPLQFWAGEADVGMQELFAAGLHEPACALHARQQHVVCQS